MIRNEYHDSPEFKTMRLLNNMAGEMQLKIQQMYDVLELIAAQHAGVGGVDKFSLVERQIQILRLEANNLTSRVADLAAALRPRLDRDPL